MKIIFEHHVKTHSVYLLRDGRRYCVEYEFYDGPDDVTEKSFRNLSLEQATEQYNETVCILTKSSDFVRYLMRAGNAARVRK